MNIIGSIQARMSSNRLPGKVLKEICGKPMLWWHIERLKRSNLLQDVVVATTVNSADDPIVDFCKNYHVKYYRGSENDVLNRIASLIRQFEIDVHVEFFGDSPLTDAGIIDDIVGFYLQHKSEYDFVSNSIKTTYPPGQEVLAYRGSALLEADESVQKDNPLREHVSIHMTKHPDKFKLYNIEAPIKYYFPELYLEVDEPADFELISKIIENFYLKGSTYFGLDQIIDFLSEHEELMGMNQKVVRRWKQFRKTE